MRGSFSSLLAVLTLIVVLGTSEQHVAQTTEHVGEQADEISEDEETFLVEANHEVYKKLFTERDTSILSTFPMCYTEKVKNSDNRLTKVSNISGEEYYKILRAGNISALQVNLSLGIFQLIDLIEKTQTVKMVISTGKSWTDCRLRWDDSDTKLGPFQLAPSMFKKLNIFTPGVRILEALNPKENENSENDISILPDGNLHVTEEYLSQFSCDIDVSMYPFDIQTCYLTFESVISEKFIALHYESYDSAYMEAHYILGRYAPSDQWSLAVLPPRLLHRSTCVLQERVCLNEGLKFRIILRRSPNYQLLNLFFPVFLIVVISSCVFMIPPGGGDKMGLSVSILLSLYMFSQLMYDKMPESNSLPLLSQYFLVCIVLVTTSCVYSALSAVFASACPRPPLYARKLVLILGPIFISDLLRKSKFKLSEHKADEANLKNGDVQESLTVDFSGAEREGVVQPATERDFDGFCVDQPDTLTWAAFGALLDRLFFAAHLVVTVSVMVAYLVHGYIPWTGYSALNLTDYEKEHMCAQLAVQKSPHFDLACEKFYSSI